MRKEIKNFGNGHRITITSEDMKNYRLSSGDIIELTITKIINNKDEKTKDSTS